MKLVQTCLEGDGVALEKLKADYLNPLRGVLINRGAYVTEADDMVRGLWADCIMGRNDRGPLPPPVKYMDTVWSAGERLAVAERMALMVVGGPDRVAANLQEIIRVTDADELIISSDAFKREDRFRSYEIIAQAARHSREGGNPA